MLAQVVALDYKKKEMRAAFTIAILLLVVIGTHSQSYHPSPAYYPVEWEIVPEWTPVGYPSLVPVESPSWLRKNSRPLGIIAWNLVTVAVGAVGDGLRDDGHKEWGHALRVAEVGMLIGGPFLFRVKRQEAVWYILDYGFLRLATFDAMYNATRGLPVLYNGTTSKYDELMNTIPDHGKAWIKAWSLSLGFVIPLCELK